MDSPQRLCSLLVGRNYNFNSSVRVIPKVLLLLLVVCKMCLQIWKMCYTVIRSGVSAFPAIICKSMCKREEKEKNLHVWRNGEKKKEKEKLNNVSHAVSEGCCK